MKATTRETTFKQVTSVERLEDNDKIFNIYLSMISLGNSKELVKEMLTWAKSDLDPMTYGDIIGMAENNNESIVYYDFRYLVAANDNIIVLYERIEKRPFNIEEVKQGKKVVTRDGRSVKIILFDVTAAMPMVGLIDDYNGDLLATFTNDGKYLNVCEEECNYDLFMLDDLK